MENIMFRKTILNVALAVGLLAAPAFAQDKQAAALPSPNASGYAEINGVKLYYALYGKGDPIVLLHGGFGLIEMFGPVLSELAKDHTVIGVDLQAHGRTLPFDRPMSFEAMADDVAALVSFLGYEKADIAGYSVGGGVALRIGIDHPEVLDKLILVSTPYAFAGWHDFNANGMRAMSGAVEQTAEGLKQTPMFQAYASVAPNPANWGKLVAQMAAFVGNNYDWSAEISKIKSPTMLVGGDWDSVRTAHLAQFFGLLGGGQNDAGWDRSGMNKNRLAILPNTTHYDIFASSALSKTIIGFIDSK
jgi:pimeloyl-ACP methyl ester carboxylesterase